MLSKPISLLKRVWRQRFFHWLDRRNPRQNHHRLSLGNLYIFPTKRGFIFLIFLIVLWLLGTNYQNNLILALTFLLVSIFIVSILHTYANLAGLEIELRGASNSFAGDALVFHLNVKNTTKKDANGVAMRWQESELDASQFDCPSSQNISVQVGLQTRHRGVLNPQRLLLATEFPLGLLRCWTWLSFDAHGLVYPQPIELPLNSAAVVDEEGDGGHPVKGGEDFNALNEYRAGDPIKHIAWKMYARERGLFTKEFSQSLSREIWLDFFQIKTNDVEQRLSALCFWALEFHQMDENYGLLIPGKKIPPNKGENHKAIVLEQLARFDKGRA